MLEWKATWFLGLSGAGRGEDEDVGRFRVCVCCSFIVELVTCPFSDNSTSLYYYFLNKSTSHFSTADLFPCLFLILVVQILSATHK
jgi:hypothetical protein